MKLTESQIQEACCGLLALDGWRRIRTDMKQLRGMGVQEPGMADDLFIRYIAIPKWVESPVPADYVALSEIFWIEWKAKKGVHGQKQREWQALERARGAVVWVSKQDFPATIEGFEAHYKASGLCRRLR